MDGGQVSLALAFVAGLASFLSPCVLPVVPGYVSFVTGVALDDFQSGNQAAIRRQAAIHSAFFILGFSLLFIVLGASATALGTVVRRALPLMLSASREAAARCSSAIHCSQAWNRTAGLSRSRCDSTAAERMLCSD